MTKKEFLNLFEEIIEADPGLLKGSETLVDIRKWDSLAVVGLIAMVDENFGLTLSAKAIIRWDELRRLGMREETYGWNLEMLMRIAAARLPALEIAVGQRRRIGGVSKVSGNLFAGPKAAWSISATFVRLALELRHRETRRQ